MVGKSGMQRERRGEGGDGECYSYCAGRCMPLERHPGRYVRTRRAQLPWYRIRTGEYEVIPSTCRTVNTQYSVFDSQVVCIPRFTAFASSWAPPDVLDPTRRTVQTTMCFVSQVRRPAPGPGWADEMGPNTHTYDGWRESWVGTVAVLAGW